MHQGYQLLLLLSSFILNTQLKSHSNYEQWSYYFISGNHWKPDSNSDSLETFGQPRQFLLQLEASGLKVFAYIVSADEKFIESIRVYMLLLIYENLWPWSVDKETAYIGSFLLYIGCNLSFSSYIYYIVTR